MHTLKDQPTEQSCSKHNDFFYLSWWMLCTNVFLKLWYVQKNLFWKKYIN